MKTMSEAVKIKVCDKFILKSNPRVEKANYAVPSVPTCSWEGVMNGSFSIIR